MMPRGLRIDALHRMLSRGAGKGSELGLWHDDGQIASLLAKKTSADASVILVFRSISVSWDPEARPACSFLSGSVP